MSLRVCIAALLGAALTDDILLDPALFDAVVTHVAPCDAALFGAAPLHAACVNAALKDTALIGFLRFFDGVIKKVETGKINGIKVDISHWQCTEDGDTSKSRYNFVSEELERSMPKEWSRPRWKHLTRE